MNTAQALLVVIVAVCFFLAAVSFSQRKKAVGSSAFGFMTLCGGAWAAVTFFEEEKIYWISKIILVKTDFALALAISLLYLIFSFRFTQSRFFSSRMWTLLYGLSSIIALLTIGPFVIQGLVEQQNGQITILNGPFYYPYVVVVGLNFVLGTYALLLGYTHSVGTKKKQFFYMTLGLLLTITIAVVTNIILPQIFDVGRIIPRIGIYSMVIYLTMTTFAITQHELFDVKVVATQLFVGLLLFAILGRILTSDTTTDIVYESLLFILSLVFGYFLVGSVNNEVKRRTEIEKLAKEKIQTLKELEQRNKNLGTLQRISDIVLQEIELRPMVQKILDEVPVQMDTAVGALVTLVQNGKLEAYTFSANEFTRKINALVGSDLSKYAYPLHKNYNKLHDALLERVVHESSNMADFVSPPLPKTMAVMLQKLIGAKYCLALPLYVGKENLGVMLFVFKAPKDQLNSKDLEMAQAIANDTTLAIERSQAFQKLKDANEYLSQLDKMKDEFISVASHELNTPLAAIEGYLSMILDEGMGKIDAKSRMYLTRAYDSSKRLAELILDLLNTSRIEQGRLKMKYSECNLAELAQSVIHELQIKADGKKVYLKLEAPKKVPLLWCDPDRIREVIVNLTGNAIKFTEKGGVTIKIEQPDHTLRVSVIDTGRGIDKVDQNKLFQKFSQVKREIDEHQGTGLGLYISKSFVDLHKGRLWVESEAGKGAAFIFELPIIDEPPKEVAGAILESTFGSPTIEVGTKDAPAIIAASSKKSS